MTTAIRLALVSTLAALLGCSNGPPPRSDYDANGCKLDCDKCPPQTYCVGAPYVPDCLQSCTTTADCDTGVCAVILSATGPRVCLSPKSLMECEAVTCSSSSAMCANDNTSLVPLAASYGTCGWQVTPCDSGCDSATGTCK